MNKSINIKLDEFRQLCHHFRFLGGRWKDVRVIERSVELILRLRDWCPCAKPFDFIWFLIHNASRVSQRGNIMFFLEIHSYDHKIMKKRNPGVQFLNLGLKRHARCGILILWITRSSKNLFGLEVRRKT